MNREILFRGFHKDENGTETIYLNGEEIKGKWVYGYVVEYTYNDTVYINGTSPKTSYIFPMDERSQLKCLEKRIEVIPETVGRYTGLDDKNGKKIFEDDIVKCKLIDQVKEKGKWVNKESYETYQVIYSQEDLGFRFKDNWMTIWKFENCELEVIGTIFDKEVER